MNQTIDACIVPLANGSLINGIGMWMRRHSPQTRVIAVCPSGAPSMFLSWRSGKPVSTASLETIADGIAVRIPIPERLELMSAARDGVVLSLADGLREAVAGLH